MMTLESFFPDARAIGVNLPTIIGHTGILAGNRNEATVRHFGAGFNSDADGGSVGSWDA